MMNRLDSISKNHCDSAFCANFIIVEKVEEFVFRTDALVIFSSALILMKNVFITP